MFEDTTKWFDLPAKEKLRHRAMFLRLKIPKKAVEQLMLLDAWPSGMGSREGRRFHPIELPDALKTKKSQNPQGNGEDDVKAQGSSEHRRAADAGCREARRSGRG